MLSDLIDVRRGEIPHTDGTALARPGVRAGLELHLVVCEACRGELWDMEEVGAAFAEFAVGEPPAQHFAEYVGIVRARIARSGQAVVQVPAPVSRKGSRRIIWGLTFGASALAAASLFIVLTRGLLFNLNKPTEFTSTPAAHLPGTRPNESIAAFPNVVIKVPAINAFVANGPHLQPLPLTDEPDLKVLQANEGKFGSVALCQKCCDNENPLLGVLLKTTRDVDRVADNGLGLMVLEVMPGSPAEAMGLRRGDYIVTANDLPLDNGGVEELVKFFAGLEQAGKGAGINLQVVRTIGNHHLFMVKEGVLGEYAPQMKR